jgi:hypothetical protein
MRTKKYSSYAAIDADLEILKLEKEINYQKLVLSVQKTKEAITPNNLVNGFFDSYKNEISNSYLSVLKWVTPYVISYFVNRKRGD